MYFAYTMSYGDQLLTSQRFISSIQDWQYSEAPEVLMAWSARVKPEPKSLNIIPATAGAPVSWDITRPLMMLVSITLRANECGTLQL